VSRRATDTQSRGLTLPPRLFGPDQVDVAYEPWQARAATGLHVGPTSSSPAVVADSGGAVSLGIGQHLGRQTVRNPGCRDTPGLRASVDGFVWGYGMPPAIPKSGWVRLVDLRADPTFEELACGPAGADFDRRFPLACGGHCDGRALTDVRPASGSAEVTARDLYLRYAPGSTAYRYLMSGDQVRLLARARRSRWLGVEIRRAEWAPRGARGWVLASGLTRT
jgi:hypothetical protein